MLRRPHAAAYGHFVRQPQASLSIRTLTELTSMPRYPMTEPIAIREYVLSVGSARKEVVVRIGRPAPFPDTPQRDWHCPWVIQGPGISIEHWAGGVDALQALLMALSGLRAELQSVGRKGRLTWLDDADLGLSLVGPAA